jgi:hypothetical protein
MSVMKKISARATNNLSGRSKSPTASISQTTFGEDMMSLVEDLNSRQLQQASKRLSKIMRDETVKMLKRGSSAERVGRSQYNKKTRGKDWNKGARVTKDGVGYLEDGWYGEVLRRRGTDKKTMAYNGGDTKSGGGNRGIITRTQKRTGKGWVSVTGPRYGQDDKDNSKYGYNYAHTLEFGAAHKAWGHNAKPLKARPFMKPAAAMAYSRQNSLLKHLLVKWGTGA